MQHHTLFAALREYRAHTQHPHPVALERTAASAYVWQASITKATQFFYRPKPWQAWLDGNSRIPTCKLKGEKPSGDCALRNWDVGNGLWEASELLMKDAEGTDKALAKYPSSYTNCNIRIRQ